MISQNLADYKDLLTFLARLPDQVSPVVVDCLVAGLDELWKQMTEEECEEARSCSLRELLGRGE